jgi:hypothetical protein
MKYKGITSFEKACEALNRKPLLPTLSFLTAEQQRYYEAHMKLTTIIEAMNFVEGNWRADYNDANQQKYFGWARIRKDEKHPSGFGVSHAHCNYDYARTAVGSRLCMKTPDMALWALDKHRDLYLTVLCN